MIQIIDYRLKDTFKFSIQLCLLSLFLSYVIAARYFQYAPLPNDSLGITYLALAYVGHFGFLTLCLWLFVIVPIVLIIPNYRLANTLITIVIGAALCVLALDTSIFQQYRFHLSLFILNLIANDTNNEIFEFSLETRVIVLAIIAILFSVLFYIANRLWRTKSDSLFISAKRVFGVTIGLYLCAHLLHVWADAQYITSTTKYNQYLPAYYPATAYRFMDKHGWLNEEAQIVNKALKVNAKKTNINYPLQPLEFGESAKNYNIMMIVVDSWRADEMNSLTSPNIFKFSQNSLRYNDHHSGSNATRSGIFSLFYGLPGVYWEAMMANQQSPVFMDTLQKFDYGLGIFSSANLINPEFDRTVFANVENLRKNSTGKSPAERDETITKEWLAWLNNHTKSDKPFFGFLFYDAPHGYSIPDGYTPFTPEKPMNYLLLSPTYDATKERNRYKNAVHYNDMLIGQVLDDLDRKSLLDETIVIITGDHGQEFNDNGLNYWGHNSNFSKAQTQVPLIVHWPKKSSQTFTTHTTHFDVIPTLMRDVFNVTTPDTNYATGGDLFSKSNRQWSIAGSHHNFAIIEQDKITVSSYDATFQVYDLHMKPIENAPMNFDNINEAMKEMKRFYKH